MVKNRLARMERLPLTNQTSRYDWKSNRDDGFSEVRLVYDKEGRLIAVDYELPEDRSQRQNH